LVADVSQPDRPFNQQTQTQEIEEMTRDHHDGREIHLATEAERYRVLAATNLTDPRTGDVIDLEQVQWMISCGITVQIDRHLVPVWISLEQLLPIQMSLVEAPGTHHEPPTLRVTGPPERSGDPGPLVVVTHQGD
jgi:hypothetical protein